MPAAAQSWTVGLIAVSTVATLVSTSSLPATTFQVEEVTDINPDGDSYPHGMVVYRDALFFHAEGPNGRQLFKTDGRSVTQVLADTMSFAGSSALTEYGG